MNVTQSQSKQHHTWKYGDQRIANAETRITQTPQSAHRSRQRANVNARQHMTAFVSRPQKQTNQVLVVGLAAMVGIILLVLIITLLIG